jgi:DNA-binding helix-hairpin-helix protein with protein kinase domain
MSGQGGVGAQEFVVRDELGRHLALEAVPFGEGGQGRVYRVRDSRLAVKLLTTVRWRQDATDLLVAQLKAIRRLPLDDLPIALPGPMLVEPHVGFVMELLDGVVPLRQLIRAQGGDLSAWYGTTGGLVRRLRVLARLAFVLARLHGRGIVYGDPSPGNVLVSEGQERNEVWLIDPDNLAIEAGASRTIVGTPGYGAPELATGGTRLSTLSDAFAFAVLAFEVLTTLHPFRGDQVYDDEQTRQQLEQDAVGFRLPWVDHSTDVSNRLTYGIGRDVVCTSTMKDLFRETFEDGLRSPARRPGMTAWAQALSRAADVTRSCRNPTCRQGFLVDRPKCPWCGHAAGPVLVGRFFVHMREPDYSDPDEPPVEYAAVLLETSDFVLVESGQPKRIQARQARLAEQVDPERALVDVQWDGQERLSLRNLDRRPMHLVTRDGAHRKRLDPDEPQVASVRAGPPGWLLHLTHQLAAPHRVLTFDLLTWSS